AGVAAGVHLVARLTGASVTTHVVGRVRSGHSGSVTCVVGAAIASRASVGFAFASGAGTGGRVVGGRIAATCATNAAGATRTANPAGATRTANAAGATRTANAAGATDPPCP